MRPGDCKACSAESQHPPTLTPHRGLTRLWEKQPSPAQLCLAWLALHLTLVCVINVFTASSSALVCQLLGLGSFVGLCVAGCPLHPWFPLIYSPPLHSCKEWTLWSSVSWLFCLTFTALAKNWVKSATYIHIHLSLFQESRNCLIKKKL